MLVHGRMAKATASSIHSFVVRITQVFIAQQASSLLSSSAEMIIDGVLWRQYFTPYYIINFLANQRRCITWMTSLMFDIKVSVYTKYSFFTLMCNNNVKSSAAYYNPNTYESIYFIDTSTVYNYSISQKLCTRFCCALLCCGYVIVHNEFKWSIYPYSSGLLCCHWGNRQIATMPVK